MTVPLTPLPGWRGGDGNAAYLDKTLRHGPVEAYFDESVSWPTIKALWFKAAVSSLVFLVFMLLVAAMAGSAGPVVVGAIGCFVVFWLVFLAAKLDEPIGEWRVVLADRAAAGDSVYSAIRGKLVERELPIQSLRARRTYSGFGVNNRLILMDGYYHTYVSVFSYGTSLYLGWMMFRTRRGATIVGRFVADLVASLAGRLDEIDLMLRTERPRAMREVVHALCREGLHVAVERIEVPVGYGFPEGLPPVEALPGAAAPSPGLSAPGYEHQVADQVTDQATWTAR